MTSQKTKSKFEETVELVFDGKSYNARLFKPYTPPGFKPSDYFPDFLKCENCRAIYRIDGVAVTEKPGHRAQQNWYEKVLPDDPDCYVHKGDTIWLLSMHRLTFEDAKPFLKREFYKSPV